MILFLILLLLIAFIFLPGILVIFGFLITALVSLAKYLAKITDKK